MIETMLFLVVWFGVGFLLLQSWWRKELDVDLGDLAILLLVSFIGPFAVILHAFSWFDSMGKVVMRRKK